MEVNTTSLKQTARIAGMLYIILSVIGAYGLAYVPSHIFVDGNTSASANNVLKHEFLLRSGAISQFISYTLYILLVFILYKLFNQVNEYQAKLMVVLVLVQVPMSFLIKGFNIITVMVVKGELLHASGLAQRDDLAYLFLRMHTVGLMILAIFWGLWLIPFGQLVYKSGFIPSIFGVLLIIAGIGWIIESFTYVLFPGYHSLVAQYTKVVCSIGEIPIMFWLLIIGVSVPKLQTIA